MDSIKLLSTRVCFASARAFTGLWFIALRVGKVDKDLHSLYVVDHVKEPLTSHMGLLSCIKNPAIWMLLSLKGRCCHRSNTGTQKIQRQRKLQGDQPLQVRQSLEVVCHIWTHWPQDIYMYIYIYTDMYVYIYIYIV